MTYSRSKSPLWRYPGIWDGRIAPVNSVPQDIGTGEAYYDTAYYYYGIGESHVFCLGPDLSNLPVNRLKVGDTVSVEQDFDVVDAAKLLRFCWHMRMPETLPAPRYIVQNGLVSFMSSNLAAFGESPAPTWSDGCQGLYVHSPSSMFTVQDADQVCTISGTTDAANSGTFRISSPLSGAYGPEGDQVNITIGRKALIENYGLVTRLNDPAVTIKMHGATWVARAYTDVGAGWVERVKLEEQPGHTWFRNELALHLSKFTGAISVKFELKLEEVL